MNKLSFIKVCICLVVLCTSFSAYAQDNVIDEVVWVVGDEAILKSDVENERLSAQYENRHFNGDPYCVIPEELAVRKLFLHQAELDSVVVSDQEVLQRVEERISYLIKEIGSREKMEEYFGKTYTQMRDMLRENIRDGLTVEEMRRKIIGDITLTPSEVRNYFRKLPQDSIPFVPTQVEVQIITLNPVIPQQEIDDIKARLRDYTNRINSGESDFSTLAILYSEDGSSIYGGEIGFKGRGELVPEYASVAFNLNDPKKVSKIVETEFGFHIIQLIEKRGDRINTRHILLRPKVSDKDLTDALNRLDSIRTDIVANKFSFEIGAQYISQDKNTKNNNGMLVNQQVGGTRFEMSALPQEVAKVVDTLQVNEISKPFIMIDQSNNREVVAIVKLKNRIAGHKANLSEDYQMIRSMYENSAKAQIIED